MDDILSNATDALFESTKAITDSIPILGTTVGNSAICVDSACTAGRACINLYCSPNPVAKVFFGASAIFGATGAVSSGLALATSFAGIPVTGWIGSFGARGFNRLGKYTLHMGNITSANITNATEIAEFMN